MKFTQLTKQLDEVYQEIRKSLEERFQAIDELQAKRRSIDNDKRFTTLARHEELSKIDKLINSERAEAHEIAANCSTRFEKVRELAHKTGSGRFKPRPEDLDQNTVTLLQYDLLSAPELIDLANNTKNMTMRRIIGNHIMKKVKDNYFTPDAAATLSKIGVELAYTKNDLDEFVDSYLEIALAGCREDATRANAVHATLYPKALENAQKNAQELDEQYFPED